MKKFNNLTLWKIFCKTQGYSFKLAVFFNPFNWVAYQKTEKGFENRGYFKCDSIFTEEGEGEITPSLTVA